MGAPTYCCFYPYHPSRGRTHKLPHTPPPWRAAACAVGRALRTGVAQTRPPSRAAAAAASWSAWRRRAPPLSPPPAPRAAPRASPAATPCPGASRPRPTVAALAALAAAAGPLRPCAAAEARWGRPPAPSLRPGSLRGSTWGSLRGRAGRRGPSRAARGSGATAPSRPAAATVARAAAARAQKRAGWWRSSRGCCRPESSAEPRRPAAAALGPPPRRRRLETARPRQRYTLREVGCPLGMGRRRSALRRPRRPGLTSRGGFWGKCLRTFRQSSRRISQRIFRRGSPAAVPAPRVRRPARRKRSEIRRRVPPWSPRPSLVPSPGLPTRGRLLRAHCRLRNQGMLNMLLRHLPPPQPPPRRSEPRPCLKKQQHLPCSRLRRTPSPTSLPRYAPRPRQGSSEGRLP